MKFLATLFVLCLFAPRLLAESITGTVHSSTGEPLENASLVLLSRRDTAFVAGTSTDAAGRFELETAGLDGCQLRVNCLGYQPQWLQPAQSMAITLEEQPVEVDEVVVEAKRPLYTKKEGRLYANVSGTRLAQEASAVNVLGQLPGVYRTGSKLSAFLKGNVLIYVDNRRVSQEELQQLDVKTIDRVEVIQQPGVEYPAGTATVLRIQTRRLLGLSAYLAAHARQGYRFSYGSDAKIQYRFGSWTFYGIGGYEDRQRKNGQAIDNTTIDWLSSTDVWDRYKGKHLNAKAGLAFSPSQHTTWLLDYRYAWRRFSYVTQATMHHTTLSNDLQENIETRGEEDAIRSSHLLSTYLLHDFTDRVKLELLANATIRRARIESVSHEEGELSPDKTIRTQRRNSYIIAGTEAKMTYAFNARHSLQAGATYSLTDLTAQLQDDSFLQNDARNLVRDQEAGAFLSYRGIPHPSVQLSLGLRYEYVQSDRKQKTPPLGQDAYSFSSIYPTASLSYSAAGLQHTLAYSNRTAHPSYRELTGTLTYLNRYLLRKGNTTLKATRAQVLSYTLAHRFFYFATEYRYARHPMLDVIHYQRDRGTLLIKSENFPSQHNLQIMANGHYELGPWQPKLTAGVIMDWHQTTEEHTQVTMKPLYILRFSNGFTLPWDLGMGIDIAYSSPGGYGLYRLTQTLDVGGYISKSFLHNQLYVSLHAEDVFSTSNRSIRMKLYEVSTRSKDHNDTRSIMLKLSYRFNRQIDSHEIPSSIKGTLERAN
ncbi:MAG: hypothetical protein CSA97_05340 [Bacteroidetes bacterium]|nr:MAG: hypothetical protein CSA97_05340 [Bacteroidota bacterium]